MPRLRRQARERRQRPQLQAEVWEYLNGKPYESLSIGAKWDVLILPTYARDECEFWERIRVAVDAGEIEVSADKVHNMFDAPMLPGCEQSKKPCKASEERIVVRHDQPESVQ